MLRLSAIIIICLCLCGCRSVRQARQAQLPENIPAGERTITAAEAGLADNSVLTLARAMEIALVYHPSIVQAKQSLVIALKQSDDAVAGYLPTLNANASYRRATMNYNPAGPKTNEANNSLSPSISLNQLVYDFGRTSASIHQAHENQLASEANLRTTENNIAYNVRQAYYGLIRQQALVKVAEEAERQSKGYLEQVKSLVKVGRRPKYDITRSEVDLNNARLNLVRAQNGLKTARATLNNTLGLAERTKYLIEEPALEEFKSGFDELIARARANHPGLIAQTARVRAASAAVDRAIAELYPSLSLNHGYNWSGSDFPLVWNWAFGTLLDWNLFSGFRKTSLIDQSVASLRIARATKTELEQYIYLELSRAGDQLEDARERLSLTTSIGRQAEENLDLTQKRYKIGSASSVELTDAQAMLTNVRSQLAEAQYDYQITIAFIKKTIGEK
ncbi:MAG: TolC family protein [Planctomycetota bacterium]